jgi:cytidylate kinase
VIAVDGPSGAGKSSVSRGVAMRLGLRYLDTGAMYRAVTWWMLERGVNVEDPSAVALAARQLHLVPGEDPANPSITLDGVEVSTAIRDPRVTSAVSAVSAVAEIRTELARLQRAAIRDGGIVVEGRDIGTVVCPDATLKVFLTASAQARAERRSQELNGAGHLGAQPETTLRDLRRRDAADTGRDISPLTMADDAVLVDATNMSLDEVIDKVVELATTRMAASAE